jgi:hypothetical protein
MGLLEGAGQGEVLCSIFAAPVSNSACYVLGSWWHQLAMACCQKVCGCIRASLKRQWDRKMDDAPSSCLTFTVRVVTSSSEPRPEAMPQLQRQEGSSENLKQTAECNLTSHSLPYLASWVPASGYEVPADDAK